MMQDILVDLNILVVDDSAQYRYEIIEILKELGVGVANIVEAQDGQEALKKIKFLNDISDKFHLIFSDINMPVMDGLKLLITIRNDQSISKTPVIMFSTESEKNIVMTALGMGITDYLVKPFDRNVARDKIFKAFVKLNFYKV